MERCETHLSSGSSPFKSAPVLVSAPSPRAVSSLPRSHACSPDLRPSHCSPQPRPLPRPPSPGFPAPCPALSWFLLDIPPTSPSCRPLPSPGSVAEMRNRSPLGMKHLASFHSEPLQPRAAPQAPQSGADSIQASLTVTCAETSGAGNHGVCLLGQALVLFLSQREEKSSLGILVTCLL